MRGDRPGIAELPAALLPPPRVDRGIGAARVERGVAPVSAGLCKNEEGLMPGAERVERGLRNRKATHD